MSNESAAALRKLVYSATTSNTPNFGGHHGVYGFESTVGTDILRKVDAFIGKLRAGQAAAEDVEEVRAQCALARTMGIFSDSDLLKADNYLDSIKESI